MKHNGAQKKSTYMQPKSSSTKMPGQHSGKRMVSNKSRWETEYPHAKE